MFFEIKYSIQASGNKTETETGFFILVRRLVSLPLLGKCLFVSSSVFEYEVILYMHSSSRCRLWVFYVMELERKAVLKKKI